MPRSQRPPVASICNVKVAPAGSMGGVESIRISRSRPERDVTLPEYRPRRLARATPECVWSKSGLVGIEPPRVQMVVNYHS